MKVLKEILNSLKEIVIEYVKSRMFPVIMMMLILYAILVHKLFVLQIVEGKDYEDTFQVKSLKTLKVESIRGNIYDCNGKLLAYNKLSYNVTFSNDAALAEKAKYMGVSETYLKNEIVYETIRILEANGDSLDVDFPIELKDGKYEFTVSGSLLSNFVKDVYAQSNYDDLTDEQKNSTAEDIVKYLRYGNSRTKNFDVSDEYSDEEALKIISCRYKLWLNRFQQYVPVNIALDVSQESYVSITEHSSELIGMDVAVSSLRVYNDATYFAPIIGYVGKASAEDLEELNANPELDVKYKSDDVVGKMGLEKFYESELRGKSGEKTMYVDNLGRVIDVVSDKPAEAGNNIYLSIDSDLQKFCYEYLEKEIAYILLNHITYDSFILQDNKDKRIPISDVYFALFNNNYISLEKMESEDATSVEKKTVESFKAKQIETMARLESIIKRDRTPLMDLNDDYKGYMEYILEKLHADGIFIPSRIPSEDPMFQKYVNDQISLAEYLEYAIKVEAIDISKVDIENAYYDSDEIYGILADYIINSLWEDKEFDKQIVKTMIKSGIISGNDVVALIYNQGVLSAVGDTDYAEFKRGLYSPYDFMRLKIEKLQITPAMLALDPCSGAVVITDVNNGEVRALVSYPSYDNNYLTNSVDSEYYNRLLEDKTSPLYNRATRQRTAPGSTFKIISSIAGVEEGVLGIDEEILTKGKFTEVFTEPRCWVYKDKTKKTHGMLTIPQAINHSCNYFFYTVGYRLATRTGVYLDRAGLNALSKYCTLFGLSEKSGIELEESEPKISDSDAVTSAIGQGTHNYTPTQIAKYVTTVANSGTCYNLSLLDRVTDYEDNLVRYYEPVATSTVDISQELWDTVHRGMRLVVFSHLSENRLLNENAVKIAGKTGTAQENKLRPNHALFISYAPYENPEVSVTIVIQNGYNSGNAAELAGFVYAYMYDKEKLETAQFNGGSDNSD